MIDSSAKVVIPSNPSNTIELYKLLEQRDAEIQRLRGSLLQVKQARLDWAMVCECSCAACETFSNIIRLFGRGAVEPTPSETGVGTLEYRFHTLCKALESRFGVTYDPFGAKPREIDILAAIDMWRAWATRAAD